MKKEKERSMIISGNHSVKGILESDFFRIKEIIIKEKKIIIKKEILKIIEKKNIKLKILGANDFNRCNFSKGNQGIIAILDPYEYFSFDDLLFYTKKEKKEISVFFILDSIEDPHNFGAILRSCAFFGINGIIIGNNNQCPINSTVIKVSTGGAAHIPIFRVNNLKIAINELKKEKNNLIISTVCFEDYINEKKKFLNNIELSELRKKKEKNIFVIFGNEGIGINKNIVENSDYLFNIKPNNLLINSLNVSVVCGIILFLIKIN